jgi:hypothetical protein
VAVRTARRKSTYRLCVRISLSVVAALRPALTSGAGAPQEPETTTFRAGVEVVRLPLTVRGADDRLVTTLSRDDFRLLVGGRPSAIDVFPDRTHALAVALLVNTWTDGEVLERYRAIGRAFVDALEASDRATIGSFSREIAINFVRDGGQDCAPGSSTTGTCGSRRTNRRRRRRRRRRSSSWSARWSTSSSPRRRSREGTISSRSRLATRDSRLAVRNRDPGCGIRFACLAVACRRRGAFGFSRKNSRAVVQGPSPFRLFGLCDRAALARPSSIPR